MEIVFATGNRNKEQEIQSLVPDGMKVMSLADLEFYDDIPETAETLEGNARIKAEEIYSKFGKACFADDTGLEVEALQGAPGVKSARYAGEEKSDEKNIDKLLQELSGESNRRARFRTVIHLIWEGKPMQFEGIVEGIIRAGRSGTNGFGYDPVFEPENCGKTFAEMSLEEKNTMSHRGRAVQKLIDFLRNQ